MFFTFTFLLFPPLTALCPDLSDPANGTVTQSGNSEDDTATYTCSDGYELVGSEVLNCQSDGTWDDSPPVCRREFFPRAPCSWYIRCFLPILTALCPDLSDPANGTVTQSGNSEDDTATYTCSDGYELVGSEVLNCQSDGTWDDSPPVCRREFQFFNLYQHNVFSLF